MSSPRWLAAAAIALAAAVTGGCSRSESGAGSDGGTVGRLPPPAPAPSTSSTPADGADAPAKLTLLDPGQAPRRKLRYAWRPHQAETLTMDLRTSASTEDGTTKQPEIALPPVHIVLAIEPRSVSPDGDLTYAWRVASTSVGGDAQTPSQVAEGMRAEVAAVERLAGTAVVSSRGLSSRVTIDAAASVDAGETGQMIEQVRQTLRDVAAPFPEEEVGRGARWEKLSRLASRDARVTQTETFTLTELSADGGALDDLLAQTAPPQPLLAPGATGAPVARIESMLASGDGKTKFDLTRLVPQTKFDGTTTMVVSGQLHEADPGAAAPSPGAEAPHRMTMVMRVGIVLAGSVAP